MAKINGAREAIAKKDRANNSAQKAALKLVDQNSESEASASGQNTSANVKKSKKKQKQGVNFSVKLSKRPKTAHSAFELKAFSSLATAISEQVSISAYHCKARKEGRKLVIALKARPGNELSTRLEKLSVGSSMSNFDFSNNFVYLKVKDTDIKLYRKVGSEVWYAEYPCIPEQIQVTYEKILGLVKFVWFLILEKGIQYLDAFSCYSFFLMICGYEYIFFVGVYFFEIVLHPLC